jgi:uncharacterized protein YndB with AHSA1/START domain
LKLWSFETESSVEIAAPVEQVWAVFADARRWPEWSEVCTEVWGELDRLWERGARFGFRLRMAGMGVPFNVEVVRADPPRCVAWSSTRFAVTARRTFEFAGGASGTRAADRKEFSSPFLPVGLWYPRRAIYTMTERWLRDLKAESERRQR